MSDVQTIQCYRCGYVFDTSYTKHCLCKGCRVSISIPDARREYVAKGAPAPGRVMHVNGGLLGAGRVMPKPSSANDLPAPVRDEHGQPVPPPARTAAPDRPPHVADDYSFIARRAKQLADETAERVAAGGPIEEAS